VDAVKNRLFTASTPHSVVAFLLTQGDAMLDLDFIKIPAGEFIMGSKKSRDPRAEDDEMPQHVLDVSDYHIMRYPVTIAQYKAFIDATGHRTPLWWENGEYPADKANHPVTGVSFGDAAAFCMWARQETGLPIRLPTEPEWEKAARGPDGRVYPWGDAWEDGRCNTIETKIMGTTAVGQFSPQGDSAYGMAEAAGNVQEWIVSLYGAYPYDSSDGREDLIQKLDNPSLYPIFRETGGTSVVNSVEATTGKSMLRGGSWRENKYQSRCAYRSWAAPMHRSPDTGFRCAYE
jgi:formylglycine-generating enzyme required for sulfatase activity